MPAAVMERPAVEHGNLTAGQVIAKHQTSAPVDVLAIAKDLGVNVWKLSLPSSMSGKDSRSIERGRSGFSIAVDADNSYVRQRFTVAHEIRVRGMPFG